MGRYDIDSTRVFMPIGKAKKYFNRNDSIDRIDVFESYIDIIDYKTGKTKKKLTVMDKIQLYIYQLFVKEKYRDKKIFLNWLYVNSNGEQKRISISERMRKSSWTLGNQLQLLPNQHQPLPAFH